MGLEPGHPASLAEGLVVEIDHAAIVGHVYAVDSCLADFLGLKQLLGSEQDVARIGDLQCGIGDQVGCLDCKPLAVEVGVDHAVDIATLGCWGTSQFIGCEPAGLGNRCIEADVASGEGDGELTEGLA